MDYWSGPGCAKDADMDDHVNYSTAGPQPSKAMLKKHRGMESISMAWRPIPSSLIRRTAISVSSLTRRR
jgi:hypothetical protein